MRKILVIRLSSLGDIVLTLPVFRALRAAYPDAQITALVKEPFADVLAGSPDISSRLLLRGGESLASLVSRVRAEKFDTVVDLHGNLRSRVVSALSGAARRVRYRKAAFARRLYVGLRVVSPELQRHTLDRYLEALRELDPQQEAFRNLSSHASENVLVIQTAFLGDAVLTTPLLKSFKTHFPHASVTVVCTPETAEIFQREADVNNVIVYDKRGKDRGWKAFSALLKMLRAKSFDLALLPHRSFKSAFMAWAAGIPRRIGFSTSQGRWLLTETVPFQWGVHDVDRNMELIKALGVEKPQAVLSMRADEAATRAVSERLAHAGVRSGDTLLGIHAGSVWATKRWLPERFAELADRAARELGAKIVFVGGPKDRPAMGALTAQMKEKSLNWTGETNLRELIAVIARCDAFVTNDSGPMHLAVACSVPTVAIFGPTSKELGFFPYGPGHQVIEKNLDCRPCGLHGGNRCPLGHFQCMRLITVDEVFAAVRSALDRRPARKAVSS